ncbi:hypothetical protein [Longimicrobium sp.]|jgi:hypothetical protein|uniref:hypothetical protein n=1 Tax=Longimicrobium sp. TaxID=2029185 RepID=UPI002F95109C
MTQFSDRLHRALFLDVHQTGQGTYLVTGGSEPHHVQTRDPNQPGCDCGDHVWRFDRLCKHILAVRIYARGASVLDLLKELKEQERIIDREKQRRAA